MIPTICTVFATDVPATTVEAFAPFVGSPLVVRRVYVFDCAAKRWEEEQPTWWQIAHVPTGMRCGEATWSTAKEAMDVLLRCDPAFPSWRYAIGKISDPATAASYYKFKTAVGESKRRRR